MKKILVATFLIMMTLININYIKAEEEFDLIIDIGEIKENTMYDVFTGERYGQGINENNTPYSYMANAFISSDIIDIPFKVEGGISTQEIYLPKYITSDKSTYNFILFYDVEDNYIGFKTVETHISNAKNYIESIDTWLGYIDFNTRITLGEKITQTIIPEGARKFAIMNSLRIDPSDLDFIYNETEFSNYDFLRSNTSLWENIKGHAFDNLNVYYLYNLFFNTVNPLSSKGFDINIIDITSNTITNNGITYTFNSSDNTVTLNGTPTIPHEYVLPLNHLDYNEIENSVYLLEYISGTSNVVDNYIYPPKNAKGQYISLNNHTILRYEDYTNMNGYFNSSNPYRDSLRFSNSNYQRMYYNTYPNFESLKVVFETIKRQDDTQPMFNDYKIKIGLYISGNSPRYKTIRNDDDFNNPLVNTFILNTYEASGVEDLHDYPYRVYDKDQVINHYNTYYGRTIIFDEDMRVFQADVGYKMAGIITLNKNLYMWGRNHLGQLGDGTETDKDTPTLITIPNGETPKQLSLGYNHSGLITEEGNLYMWGYNSYGQLGDGTEDKKNTPTLITIPNGETPKDLQVGDMYTALITEEGNLYMWGYNGTGVLLTGDTSPRNTPTLITIPNGETPKKISLGEGHLLLQVEGDDKFLYGWGLNYNGQLGILNGRNTVNIITKVFESNKSIISFSAGDKTSGLILEDGTFYMTGLNNQGQLGLGITTNDISEWTSNFIEGFKPTQIELGSVNSVITDGHKVFITGYEKTFNNNEFVDMSNYIKKYDNTVKLYGDARLMYNNIGGLYMWGDEDVILDNPSYPNIFRSLPMEVIEGYHDNSYYYSSLNFETFIDENTTPILFERNNTSEYNYYLNNFISTYYNGHYTNDRNDKSFEHILNNENFNLVVKNYLLYRYSPQTNISKNEKGDYLLVDTEFTANTLSGFIDDEPPVFNDNVQNTFTLLGRYFDPLYMVSAIDNFDGFIYSTAIDYEGYVDTDVLGTYEITYIAIDKSGNEARKTIIVTVIENLGDDTTPPVIYYKGIPLSNNNETTISLNSSFNPLKDIEVIDNIDGEIEINLSHITSNVNVGEIGEYEIIYTVTDSQGNTSVETRIINVVKTTDDDTVTPPPKPPLTEQINNFLNEWDSGGIFKILIMLALMVGIGFTLFFIKTPFLVTILIEFLFLLLFYLLNWIPVYIIILMGIILFILLITAITRVRNY